MSETVAPDYARFVDAERRASRLAAAPEPLAEGELWHPVAAKGDEAAQLLRVAAQRAVGLYRATTRREVVWVEGDRELAVGFADLQLLLEPGLLRLRIPVRCDQTGATHVEVAFAVGSPDAPAGLFASTFRRPSGSPLIVDAWGDALVAFAWQCVLGLVTGLAAAVGKDSRGNVLVPVELSVSRGAMQILPMARHRFSGSSGLTTKVRTTP